MADIKLIENEVKDRNAKIVITVITLVLTILFAALGGVILDAEVSNANNNYGGSGGSNGSGSYIVSGTLYLYSNSVYISGDGNYVYYSFTPSYSGNYTFSSTCSSSSTDPAAVLLNSSWSQLTSDDDSGSNRNFRISRYLYSGNTYYLGVKIINGTSYNSYNVPIYVEY